MTRKRSRLVSINPRLRNLCINKLILGRVVPTISDNSSCDIFSSMRVLCWSLSAKPKRQKRTSSKRVAGKNHRLSEIARSGTDHGHIRRRSVRHWHLFSSSQRRKRLLANQYDLPIQRQYRRPIARNHPIKVNFRCGVGTGQC